MEPGPLFRLHANRPHLTHAAVPFFNLFMRGPDFADLQLPVFLKKGGGTVLARI